jgi:hypothetical protein
MKCDPISIFLAERLEFIAGDSIELVGRDALGDERIVMARSNGSGTERVAILGRLALARIPVAAGRSAGPCPQSLFALAGRSPVPSRSSVT